MICLRSDQTGKARERSLCEGLNAQGLATLALNTLTENEQEQAPSQAWHRFNIPRLARRITAALDWRGDEPRLSSLPTYLLATGNNAAASLVVAARHPHRIQAVICRSGRPDLAGSHLARVHAPVLFAVGERDSAGRSAMQRAVSQMRCSYRTALFAEVGAQFQESDAWPTFIELSSQWLLTQSRLPMPAQPYARHSLIFLNQMEETEASH
ncbi:dienelactone hydrolase family protein [Natronospira sp.]|uniref:dienelactone hydrolase family protein n=1 Tax=Natronospira sp. TaxID=2024970 RepID=UPI0038739993